MVTEPAPTPVTIPKAESTLAIDVLLLVQIPPAVVLASVVDAAAQILTAAPGVIAAGRAITDNANVAGEQLPNE